jgi:hypothetical protein
MVSDGLRQKEKEGFVIWKSNSGNSEEVGKQKENHWAVTGRKTGRPCQGEVQLRNILQMQNNGP